uniref:Uncharacterized protein n=1 Tax=Cereibacter sphaeroides (strain ATCC 17025 / ATH 2.4.3) TaxID=349102 RepID=A4WPM1_CERS5
MQDDPVDRPDLSEEKVDGHDQEPVPGVDVRRIHDHQIYERCCVEQQIGPGDQAALDHRALHQLQGPESRVPHPRLLPPRRVPR